MVSLRDKTLSGKEQKTMKVRVIVRETQVTEKTYEIDGVNTLETAGKCAMRAATGQFQPNAFLYRVVPYPPTKKIATYEIVEC